MVVESLFLSHLNLERIGDNLKSNNTNNNILNNVRMLSIVLLSTTELYINKGKIYPKELKSRFHNVNISLVVK